jgi:hypothetical protein
MPRVHLPDGRIVNFPDGMPEQEIASAIAKLSPQAAPAAPAEKKGGGIVDALPSILGTGFSLAGGSKALPTGMALSALGGAAGEGIRQVVRSVQGQWGEVPDSMGGRLKAMGREAVGQGGLEGIGRGAAKVVTPIAKAAYGLALRPAKALQKTYGLKNIVNQGFADRVMPNALGESRAGRLVGESAAEATGIANKSQTPIKLKNVLQRALDDQGGRMRTEMESAGITPPIDKVAGQVANVLDSNADEVTPGRLLELRRGADAVADPAFKQARLPGGAGRVPAGTDASVARSMANAERQTLDDVLGPQFQQVNARTRARSGVMQATKDAAMRPNMLTNLIAGGAGASALAGDGDMGDAAKRALMFRTLFSPTAQAGAAFAAPAVAKYGPRVADVATGGGAKDALLAFLMGGGE